ncbi:MAG: putative toxin-antitoxin system toxin component, PIN family [Candidatus Omnitrophica bacterium]|nr:putative toxin-antitoxin system toxin component, PIN family [Candidatus Omnitrophota bacterium]
MLKVVIDTNVFISGVLTAGGNPSTILKAWKRIHKYQLFVTEDIIREILKVMSRLDIEADIILDWNKMIRKNATIVKPKKKITVIREDPSDDKFLECAFEVNADYIVSGDEHLKKLTNFEGIEIIDAKKFVDILRTEKS